MRRVFDGRLARLTAESIRFDATAGLDLRTLRARNTVCDLVRRSLVEAGIDPEIATALQLGGTAAHMPGDRLEERRQEEELAADDHDGLAGVFTVRIRAIARRFRDGYEPDFTAASLAELFAWCVARRGSCD